MVPIEEPIHKYFSEPQNYNPGEYGRSEGAAASGAMWELSVFTVFTWVLKLTLCCTCV